MTQPRRLTPCHRHPDHRTTTGLCPPCLYERLSLLHPSPPPPELRRCNTFSAATRAVADDQPRRRSCDVRGGRNSLSSLLSADNNAGVGESLGVTCRVLEEREEEESIPEGVIVEEGRARVRVRVCDDGEFEDGKTMKEFIDLELEGSSSKSVATNRKDLKDIAGGLLSKASVFSKKLRRWRKEEGRGRREVDDGVSHNVDRICNGDGVGVSLGEMRLENLRGRRLSYTQSEVGDYGFGRRSCDGDVRGSVDLGRASIDCGGFGRKSCDGDPRGSIDCGGFGRKSCDGDPRGSIDCGGLGRKSCDSDPRFSIDLGRASVDCGGVGRMSVEEGRGEFDASRASWDGYLVGGEGRGVSGLPPRVGGPVVSVIENAMATVYGFDNRVLSEGKVKVENGEERRRKGFDRCSSVKKEMVVMPEDVEGKALSSARVSSAAIGIFDGTKLLITEKELNEWRLNSMKDDSSESFETASKDFASVSSSSNGKGFKKCRQWSKLWSMWGLLNRKKGDNCGDEYELPRRSVDSTVRNGNREALVRSYSTTSSHGSSSVVGSVTGAASRTESMAIVRRRQDDVVLERSRSSKYSPNQVDNGLLRLYLTPLRSRRRNKLGKSRLKNSRSLAKSVLSLY